MDKMLVIGIGNSMREDDGVGAVIIEKLKKHIFKKVDLIEHEGETMSLISAWEGRDKVIVIDAMSSGVKPGTVRRFDVSNESLPLDSFPLSSHAVSLQQTIELARSLYRLPRSLIVFRIEGKQFNHGEELSLEVRQVVDQVVTEVIKEIGYA